MPMPPRADESKKLSIEPFSPPDDDPLQAAHADVVAWVEAAISSSRSYYLEVPLKSLPAGQKLMDAGPEYAVRYVLAAVTQVAHWDRQAVEVKTQAATAIERMNAHHLPGWEAVWGRRQQAEVVVSTLMRRALPFQKGDLLS